MRAAKKVRQITLCAADIEREKHGSVYWRRPTRSLRRTFNCVRVVFTHLLFAICIQSAAEQRDSQPSRTLKSDMAHTGTHDIPTLDDHPDLKSLKDYDHPSESLRRWRAILTAKVARWRTCVFLRRFRDSRSLCAALSAVERLPTSIHWNGYEKSSSGRCF